MVCRGEIISKLDPQDRKFIDRCQLIAVLLFLAIYVAIIVWWALAPAGDPPGAALQAAAPAVASAAMHASSDDRPVAP